jgi:hypothetical protein
MEDEGCAVGEFPTLGQPAAEQLGLSQVGSGHIGFPGSGWAFGPVHYQKGFIAN